MDGFWRFQPFHSSVAGGGVDGFRGSMASAAAALMEGMSVGRQDENENIILLFRFHLQLSQILCRCLSTLSGSAFECMSGDREGEQPGYFFLLCFHFSILTDWVERGGVE